MSRMMKSLAASLLATCALAGSARAELATTISGAPLLAPGALPGGDSISSPDCRFHAWSRQAASPDSSKILLDTGCGGLRIVNGATLATMYTMASPGGECAWYSNTQLVCVLPSSIILLTPSASGGTRTTILGTAAGYTSMSMGLGEGAPNRSSRQYVAVEATKGGQIGVFRFDITNRSAGTFFATGQPANVKITPNGAKAMVFFTDAAAGSETFKQLNFSTGTLGPERYGPSHGDTHNAGGVDVVVGVCKPEPGTNPPSSDVHYYHVCSVNLGTGAITDLSGGEATLAQKVSCQSDGVCIVTFAGTQADAAKSTYADLWGECGRIDPAIPNQIARILQHESVKGTGSTSRDEADCQRLPNGQILYASNMGTPGNPAAFVK